MIMYAELSQMSDRELQEKHDAMAAQLDDIVLTLEKMPMFGTAVQNSQARELTSTMQALQADYEIVCKELAGRAKPVERVNFFR